jgi:hypothetical protein
MTAERLTHLAKRNNLVQGCAGTLGLCCSAVLWYASFWFFRGITLLWMFLLRCMEVLHRDYDGWNLSFYIAAGCTIALAVEGLRRAGGAFDLLEFSDSWFNVVDRAPRSYSTSGYPDPFANAWVLLQCLFLAPRATIVSLTALRSIVATNVDVIEQAAFILTKLEADRRWTAASTFGDSAGAIRVLARLDLIWVEDKEGEIQIRFPAGASGTEIEA